MKAIPPLFLDGGAGLNRGHLFRTPAGTLIDLPTILASIGGGVYANAAAAAALGADDQNGLIMVGGRPYFWQPNSLANDSTSQLAITPSGVGPTTPGRWDLAANSAAVKMAVDYTTADATVLFTVPAGWTLAIPRFYYEVSVSFVGSSGRVGASSSNAQYSTNGDLIGGASGDAAAALAAGIRGGTLGTKYGTNGAVELGAGDTIKWNVIAAGYTAGAANLVALVTRA